MCGEGGCGGGGWGVEEVGFFVLFCFCLFGGEGCCFVCAFYEEDLVEDLVGGREGLSARWRGVVMYWGRFELMMIVKGASL